MSGASALVALRQAADHAAQTIGAAHPSPDLYARPADDPERQWATLVRFELDDLAAAVDDLREHLTTLHTDDTQETR